MPFDANCKVGHHLPSGVAQKTPNSDKEYSTSMFAVVYEKYWFLKEFVMALKCAWHKK